MIVTHVNSIHDAYLKGVHLINSAKTIHVKRSDGSIVDTKALHNAVFVLRPRADMTVDRYVRCKLRKCYPKIQKAEFAWYMLGTNKVEPILKYIPGWQRFSDDNVHVNSNYGSIWKSQVPGIIQKIVRDKYTRQGAIQIYNGKLSNDTVTKDVQCTLSLVFAVEPSLNDANKDRLTLTVFMRSNDIVHGLPIDMFCFSTLHELVLNELVQHYDFANLEMGEYTHIARSLHYYGSDDISLHINDGGLQYIGAPYSMSKTTTYSNFWYAKDAYIFGNADTDKHVVHAEHFISRLSSDALY